MDHEQRPLEKVGGGQKGKWDEWYVGLYKDLIPATLQEAGIGSVAGNKEDKAIASSSQAF